MKKLICALALLLCASMAGAQIVGIPRDWDDLVATHPCNAGLLDRIAVVMDAQSTSSIGGGGGSTWVWVFCDGVDTWTLQDIGSVGGLPGADEVTESMLKAVDSAADEECLTYESTVGDFEWQTCSSATIAGTLGTVDNAVPRADSTGGSTAQGSDVTISDPSVSVVTIATTPGNALAVKATAPTATTGASQAGKAASLAASDAVASTDTAGAAAGGGVEVRGGAAARNASGNADGGGINLLPGAGVGTGVTGKVGVNISNPYRQFSVNGKSSFGDGDQTQDALDAVLHVALTSTDSSTETMDATVGWYGISMAAVNGNSTLFAIGHENGVGPVIGARQADLLFGGISSSGTFTEFARVGSSGTGPAMTVKGYVSTWGRNCLNSDFTSTSVTFANLTGMSTTLTASRKYAFRLTARYNDSTAADGANFDFDGGTATATTFGVNCRSIDTTGLVAGIISSDATALATDHTASDVTGAASLVCEGFIEVNAGGTFLPRAAQQAASGGTLTVNKGSCLFVDDMSFN